MAPIHLKLINLIALCTLVHSSAIYRTQQSNALDAPGHSHNSKANMQGSSPSGHLHVNMPRNQGDNHDGQGDSSFPNVHIPPRTVGDTYLDLGTNQPDLHAWGGTHLPTRSSHRQDTISPRGVDQVTFHGPQELDTRSVEGGAKAVPGAHSSKASTANDGEYNVAGLGTPTAHLPGSLRNNNKREVNLPSIPGLSVPTKKNVERQAKAELPPLLSVPQNGIPPKLGSGNGLAHGV